jgi:hypothetical protein
LFSHFFNLKYYNIYKNNIYLIFYNIFSIKESSSSLHFQWILSTEKLLYEFNQIFFISSLKSFWFLLRSFWLHLSNFVNTIENSIHSSIKHLIISTSIFWGGILPSIKRNVFFNVFLVLKNSCVKSSHHFLSFSHNLAYPYHGKSTITRKLFITKKLNNLVFHGIFEHFAKSFLWVNILINEDFHTFERQKNANSGKFRFGHCLISGALFINSADVIFILTTYTIKQQYNIKSLSKIKVK